MKDLILGNIIAFVGCVVFPGFVTAIAPVSWITFERTGDRVVAQTRQCLFFVIPYLSKTIDPVVGIGDRFIGGTVDQSRTNRRGNRSEDQGFLVIHGSDQSVEVPVTPFNIKSVVKRADDFLADQQATSLKMTVVANWKFSVVAGGLVSLLTVFYVLGLIWSFCRGVLRLFGFGLPAKTA